MSILRELSRKLHGPRSHVSAEQKAWVERRMIWLKEQFGSEPIRRSPLDPSSELLPKKWDRSYAAGADLFNRLCAFMLVDASRSDLTPIGRPVSPILSPKGGFKYQLASPAAYSSSEFRSAT